MIFSSKSASTWRDTASKPGQAPPPRRSPGPPLPSPTRWWKLAGVAIAGLFTLAAASWAVFWIHPPRPAHLITLVANYDNTLAIPTNPYGKAGARNLADLTKPGGWLRTPFR